MDRLTLPGTGIEVSRLGFGCAAIMGRMSRARSVRVLHAAFDAGVTHFDAARSYGYGEAELALGDLIAAVGRNRVTVATKFGIVPPRRRPVLSAARAVARLVAQAHPAVQVLLRRRAEAMVRPGLFDVPSAVASLEASLRALRTDHVDLLLLHECGCDDLSDELLAFLNRVRRDGKIRQHGIAARPVPSAEILKRRTEFAPVVQVASSVWEPWSGLPGGASGTGPALIAHSALGTRFTELRSRLAGDPAMARAWSRALGFDAAREAQRLAGLCLATAAAHTGGAVLFSSTDAGNIQANVTAAGTGRALDGEAARIAALRVLMASASGGSTAAEPGGGGRNAVVRGGYA